MEVRFAGWKARSRRMYLRGGPRIPFIQARKLCFDTGWNRYHLEPWRLFLAVGGGRLPHFFNHISVSMLANSSQSQWPFETCTTNIPYIVPYKRIPHLLTTTHTPVGCLSRVLINARQLREGAIAHRRTPQRGQQRRSQHLPCMAACGDSLRISAAPMGM
jgi:hypothetical protein